MGVQRYPSSDRARQSPTNSMHECAAAWDEFHSQTHFQKGRPIENWTGRTR
jgi:hypothetical protein